MNQKPRLLINRRKNPRRIATRTNFGNHAVAFKRIIPAEKISPPAHPKDATLLENRIRAILGIRSNKHLGYAKAGGYYFVVLFARGKPILNLRIKNPDIIDALAHLDTPPRLPGPPPPRSTL